MGSSTSGTPHDFLSLKPGGHVCLPFADVQEKLRTIAGFIHDGILRGERCLYWGRRDGYAALLPHLDACGASAATLAERSALVFAEVDCRFEVHAQPDAIRAAASAATADGFTGIRFIGDPDLQTRRCLDHQQLASFEASLSEVYRETRATGLCTFDQRAMDASSLEVALIAHADAILAGRLCHNPLFKASPDQRASDWSSDRLALMAASMLETERNRDLLEAESAALILEGSRSAKRDADYRAHIAALTRAVEARDRLLITAARWLSRPLPVMCTHLDDLSKDRRYAICHDALDTCSEHLAAIARLSHGLDEIAGFLQMQMVLRPEQLDIVEIGRSSIREIKGDVSLSRVEIVLEGADKVSGTWDRLRMTHLFQSLIRTARDQGYDTYVRIRIDDLIQFVRIRVEFTLPHAPALSDSGERVRTMAYGPAGESDYERLAVQLWPSREIVRIMGGTLGISTWADARVVFTCDLPKVMPTTPSQLDTLG